MMERSRSSPDIIGILQKDIAAMASSINVLEHRDHSIPTWIAPTFIGAWVNFGGVEDIAGYWRNSAGVVMTKGVVKSGTVPSDLFQMGPGFRPLVKKRFPIVSNNLFGIVSISELGIVRMEVGSNLKVELSGIMFRAEQ